MTVSRKYIGQHPPPKPPRPFFRGKAPPLDTEVTYHLISADNYESHYSVGLNDPIPRWTFRQGRVVNVVDSLHILVRPIRGTVAVSETTIDVLTRPHGSAPWKASTDRLGSFYWHPSWSAHWRKWVPTSIAATGATIRECQWSSLLAHGAVPAWFTAPNDLSDRRDRLWEEGRRLHAIGVPEWGCVPDNSPEWMVLTLMSARANKYVGEKAPSHVAKAIVRDRHRMVDLRHERPLWEAQVGWCVFFEPSTRDIFTGASIAIPSV